jgi:hypothetical protein
LRFFDIYNITYKKKKKLFINCQVSFNCESGI